MIFSETYARASQQGQPVDATIIVQKLKIKKYLTLASAGKVRH